MVPLDAKSGFGNKNLSEETFVATGSSERGKQLGEFLKYMRAHTTPESLGLDSSGRRRTQGLRRQEVADVVGVSVDWYTWLEQGRDVQASESVVKRLSQIFRLNADQHAYLFRLARPQSYLVEDIVTSVPDRLLDMINSLRDRPAYIRNIRWDIVAHNAAFAKIFSFSRQPELPNIMRMLFAESNFRAITDNWTSIIEQVVARFRNDRSRNPEDECSTELIHELQAISPEFRELWSQYRVTETSPYPLEITHPVGGRFRLDRVPFRPETTSGLTVVIYLPVDEESRRAVSAMCS
ncbi:XRE family transcriptional regulator [Paraburkholderia dipogonis]|uniref:XRE family transcriptional regulator n=1 Tax=Paraburkholderia dipogonis TaxID=1211383 RepID=A0A4Y8MKR9_9BURK|nr:helix-turn-helix transcriptional regulator [Paraburkholderia dipogonis]TFE38076.1 XRE family transcriptional regulator [Paraburkholderia dipogonis]